MNTKVQKQLIHHLHRLQGQLAGIERMVNEDKYCIDVLTQSMAVEKSLQSFNASMLKNHLEEHVGHMLASKKDHNKAIAELLKIYKLHNK